MTLAAPSIDNIKGSDGTSETVRAIVTAQRVVGSTIIEVNSLTGFNTSVIGTTGALDADGRLTIRAQVFFGHLSGSDIEIDEFAPGYTDDGNEVGDIVIIKPTTAWADEVAALLEVVHEDDGSLKDDSVGPDAIQDDAVTEDKILDYAVSPEKRSGGFASGILSISTTGNKTVTGVGFTPKLVLFSYGSVGGVALNNTRAIGDGRMTPAAQSARYIAIRLNTTASAGASAASESGSLCVYLQSIVSGGGSVTDQLLASYVSMNADGFTINASTVASATDVFWVALG